MHSLFIKILRGSNFHSEVSYCGVAATSWNSGKSCIVAIKKIDKIDNQYVVINNVQLLLAKNHREALLSALN
jgi:hypothetical protein